MLYAYRYARHKTPWDEDAPGEFVLFVEPVLRRLFAKWEDRGIPIEHAVAKIIKYQFISACSARMERSVMHAAAIASDASAGVHVDPEREEAPQLPTLRLGADRRYLYFAALSCPELPEAHLLAIAEAAGVGASEALRARCTLEIDDTKAERFRRCRDHAYSRLLAAQLGLVRETNPDRRTALLRKELRARSTLAKARRKLATCKARPTHAEIGRATATPKGTVDSGLYWIRRRIPA